MQLRFNIDGQTQLSKVLLGIEGVVRDWTPALSTSAADIIDFIQNDVFNSEGEAIGDPWQPLSPGYAKQKERKYPGMPILQATGHMRESFGATIDASSLTVWNSATYFKYHQSRLPRKKIPRRVMMYLTDNLKQTIVKNFQTQFLEAVGGL